MQRRPRTQHRAARNHSSPFYKHGFNGGLPRKRRDEPSTAEHEIIPNPFTNHGFYGWRSRQRCPRTEYRGARNHSKSDLKPWIPGRADEAATSPNRSPQNTKSFKYISKTMDSTVGCPGNDASNRAPRSTPFKNNGFHGWRSRQRRPRRQRGARKHSTSDLKQWIQKRGRSSEVHHGIVQKHF